MSELENKKPAVSKMSVFAICLPVLAIALFLYPYLFAIVDELPEIVKVIIVYILFLSLIGGIAFGIISIIRIKKSKGMLRGLSFSITAVIISTVIIILQLLPLLISPRDVWAKNELCLHNTKRLCLAIKTYTEDHNNTYLEPNRWCDSVWDYIKDYKVFICPNGPGPVEAIKCHYAMNPNCEPNSPNDTVLVFEAKGGWNKYGGPELLMFNHKKEGAVIGFNDGHVEFIKPEDVNKLKWK